MAPQLLRAAGEPSRASSRAALLIPSVTVGALALADGGFFPSDWRWAGAGLAALGLGALLSRDAVAPSRADWWFLMALAGLVAWIALSAAWSSDASRSLLEAERGLVLVLGVAAFLLWVRRGSAGFAVAGLLFGITATVAYGLGRYLLGERVLQRVEQGLLFQPIGYSNAVAIFAAIGVLLAAGAIAKGPRALTALGSGALVPLLTSLTLAGSRAAWLALACGGAALIVLDSGRRHALSRLVVLSTAGLAAVALSARADLARPSLAPADFETEALRLGVGVLLLAGAAALLGFVFPSRSQPRARRALAAIGLVAAAVVAAAGFAFARPERGEVTDLGIRAQYWQVAWDAYIDHPWLGTGAGTYELSWAARRPVADSTRDAHSLYLESLSELGPVGSGLLGLALAVPLVAAVRARERSFVPAAAAAYVAYLVHAAFDWDWEVPAVTLAALFSGAVVLVAARPDGRERRLGDRLLVAGAALELAAAAVLVARLAAVV